MWGKRATPEQYYAKGVAVPAGYDLHASRVVHLLIIHRVHVTLGLHQSRKVDIQDWPRAWE